RLAKDDPLMRAAAREKFKGEGGPVTDKQLADVKLWTSEMAAMTGKDPTRLGTITGDTVYIERRAGFPRRGDRGADSAVNFDFAVQRASERVEAIKNARNEAFVDSRDGLVKLRVPKAVGAGEAFPE